ncbi:SDR family NAD(P)-dependent oxidoreductase [Nocardioides bruguierae]|uniref:SDR family NAD(P)-dependent oxidoreductase n=1 Tax=Nocardioides bruguierae TaxID=2945102 RepID=A0A9X2IGJ4_9ACTN|nr:SDR family NAD(P)-dependent oxidoreductase [Nocardioides bruguierae]MCM0620845.1 SDR family NAD(P)-dependent oxidoreductase [Nocardioides bruguierae]
MPTIAIIGAGANLGAAVTRRFAKEGFSVALVSRHLGRVQDLAADLADETGAAVRGYSADVTDRDALRAALQQASADLGPVEVLQYSPLPAKEFLRPVLETTVEDLQPALDFSVHGLLTAVHQVQQHMRVLGGGTVLLVNGGSAVRPVAHFAGTSVSFAAESALGQMFHDALKDDGIHVGQLIIPGAIEEGHPNKDPEVLAEKLWTIHSEKGEFRTFAQGLDD